MSFFSDAFVGERLSRPRRPRQFSPRSSFCSQLDYPLTQHLDSDKNVCVWGVRVSMNDVLMKYLWRRLKPRWLLVGETRCVGFLGRSRNWVANSDRISVEYVMRELL